MEFKAIISYYAADFDLHEGMTTLEVKIPEERKLFIYENFPERFELIEESKVTLKKPEVLDIETKEDALEIEVKEKKTKRK